MTNTWDLKFIKTYMKVNKLNPMIVDEAIDIAQNDKSMEILLQTWMNSGDPSFQKYIYDQIEYAVLETVDAINDMDC